MPGPEQKEFSLFEGAASENGDEHDAQSDQESAEAIAEHQPSRMLRPSGTDGKLTQMMRHYCRELGVDQLADKVFVHWNTRLQTTAGTASPTLNRIDLNPRLLDCGEQELFRTLKHELAHLIAHQRARGRRIQSHGPEWKRACAELGIPGEKSTHSLPFPRRRVRPKYAYRCPHCAHIVTRVRKFSRYVACYPCCRKFNRGEYTSTFQYEPIPLTAEVIRLATSS